MRKIVAEKLRTGVQGRCNLLSLSLANLAQSINRDPTTVRAWLRGVNRITLEDAVILDSFFARQGLPGLLDEMRTDSSTASWQAEELPLQSLPAQFADIAQALRAEIRQPAVLLAAHGLLEQCSILLRADEAVLPLHVGAKLPMRLGPDVFGRDVRHMSDQAYGALIHRQARELLQRDRPMLHRISSAITSYRRLTVPVNGRFVISLPYDINAKSELVLD